MSRSIEEDLSRTASPGRYQTALGELTAASAAFARGDYRAAAQHGRKAKQAAPRDPAVRELLGLAAYQLGDWKPALSELRTYRRLTADTRHMPVEMDVLRAMDRPDDVTKVWNELLAAEATRATRNEARVVYASFLLDQGNAQEAWRLVGPPSGKALGPGEERMWFVAARVAVARGDIDTARRLTGELVAKHPELPGLDELDTIIGKH